jgi:hypothetical protein
MGVAMKLTEDAVKVRKLEQQLLTERQLRIRTQQELGGLKSLARRLQLTLLAERAAKQKPEMEKAT